MTHIRADSTSAVPWWAAFGAPLIGVPLLVLLLAVGAPGEAANAPAPDPDPLLSTEQVETPPAHVAPTLNVALRADLPSSC